jgi:uncharacterized RDD family membrane protein YckC
MTSKTKLVSGRLKAFGIDYLLILSYILLLSAATLLLSKMAHLDLKRVSPATAELIGFFTLTFPVILYFTLSEANGRGATIGKNKQNLKVISVDGRSASMIQLFTRNIVKFLPWEIAHYFIYQLYYFDRIGVSPPARVTVGLICAQALAIIYLLLIFFSKNNRTIYEWISGTRVVRVGNH